MRLLARSSSTPAALAAVAAAVVLGVATPGARATELRLAPTADATIFHDLGGSGSYDAVADSKGDALWTSVVMRGVARRALLEFDLSGIPAGQQVVGASLRLYLERSQGRHDVSLYRVQTAWGEGSSVGLDGLGAPATAGDPTWAWADYQTRAWHTPGGDVDATASAVTFVDDQARWYEWTSPALLADVQGWVADPAGNHGWMLVGREDQERNALRFGSREGIAPPQLVLQLAPIPEPAPMAMLLAGLAVLAWRLRQRTAAGG